MESKVLEFINNNWFLIVIAIAVMVYAIDELIKIRKKEKIEVAKHLIAAGIDAIVAEAELKYADYKKSGHLKRLYVIQTIYEKYPIFNKVANQEELFDWIDKLIEQAMVRLKLSISEIDKK